MNRGKNLQGVLAAAIAMVLGGAGIASAAYITVVDNGPSSNRVDIVFLGDGYRAVDLTSVYPAHINAMVNHLFNGTQDPYPRYRSFFNVHRIDVVSNEAGADIPPQNVYRDTALDAKYFADGVTDRLLSVNNTKANAALNAGLAGAGFTAEVKYVTVNDTRYGGAGGSYAVYAGGNGSATEIALHESAHSFNGLADEYVSYTGAYTGNEPSEVNVTKNSSGAKWAHWIGYNQPIIGTIGVYEGAKYYPTGIYRPSHNSKMRSLGRPFDAVAREKIILDIYNRVNPLDSYTSNAGLLTDPILSVDPIDPDVIDVQWMVDGLDISGATDWIFNPADWNLSAGAHTITAHAYDPTDWVRINLQNLRQDVTWNVILTPEPGGMMLMALLLPTVLRRSRRFSDDRVGGEFTLAAQHR